MGDIEIVSYADHLAHKNSEALSFIPRPRLEQYAATGQIMVELENGEPCGFLVHGNGYPVMKIYQHCIQYDARNMRHGLALVKRLIEKCFMGGIDGIALKCASDLEANAFWMAAGFRFVCTIPGGERRSRKLNVWYMPISAIQYPLWDDSAMTSPARRG